MHESDLEKRAFDRKYVVELFAVYMEIREAESPGNPVIDRQSCRDFIIGALKMRKKTRHIQDSLVDSVVNAMFEKHRLDDVH